MAQIPHVQPGDLITSELINQIIDALGGLDEKITKGAEALDEKITKGDEELDAKITKCCEEHAKEPKPEEPRDRIFITEVVPADAVYGNIVHIIGGGFIPDERGNEVFIANERVTKFGKVTRALIQAEVPGTIISRKRTPAAVSVKNRNGLAEFKITVGPQTKTDVPWVPTDDKVVEEMLKLAGVTKADILYDLGSGDGRIVVKAASAPIHAKAIGIELDADLIKRANELAAKHDVVKRAAFRQENYFDADFSDATVVTMYLTPEVNLKLRPKLEKLQPGTRIVTHTFDLGDNWKHVGHSNTNGKDVYLWVVGKQ